MKKFLAITLFVILAILVAIPMTTLADDPTVTVITWNGAGFVGGTVNSGDSNATFATNGAVVNGSITVRDENNNPYSYGVDSFSSYLNATVTNGFITTDGTRTNSYTPMYGNGGQYDYALLIVSGGTGSMAFRTTTNFAAMVDGTYTFQLPGGHNIIVNATTYTIERFIRDGRGDSGDFYAIGNGSATLDCMSSEASGVWNLTLARGAGCYTDANFNATGTNGQVLITATGVDSVVFNGMGASSGGGTLQFVANWLNSFSITDYSLTTH